jgi:hypothetical protein
MCIVNSALNYLQGACVLAGLLEKLKDFVNGSNEPPGCRKDCHYFSHFVEVTGRTSTRRSTSLALAAVPGLSQGESVAIMIGIWVRVYEDTPRSFLSDPIKLLTTPLSTTFISFTLSRPQARPSKPLKKLAGVEIFILKCPWSSVQEWEIERLLDIWVEAVNSPQGLSAFLHLFDSLRVLHLRASHKHARIDDQQQHSLTFPSSLRAVNIYLHESLRVASTWLIPPSVKS